MSRSSPFERNLCACQAQIEACQAITFRNLILDINARAFDAYPRTDSDHLANPA